MPETVHKTSSLFLHSGLAETFLTTSTHTHVPPPPPTLPPMTGPLLAPRIKDLDPPPLLTKHLDTTERKRHAGAEWQNILKDYWPCLKKYAIIPCPIGDTASPSCVLSDI